MFYIFRNLTKPQIPIVKIQIQLRLRNLLGKFIVICLFKKFWGDELFFREIHFGIIFSSNSDANSGDGDTFVNDTAMVPAKEQSSRRQHQVLWNLFAHNLDSVIMSAIDSKEFKMWYVYIITYILFQM